MASWHWIGSRPNLVLTGEQFVEVGFTHYKYNIYNIYVYTITQILPEVRMNQKAKINRDGKRYSLKVKSDRNQVELTYPQFLHINSSRINIL